MGDNGNLEARIRKSLGGDLHTPLGQILDRRTAHDLGKAIGQRRTSRSSFRSELFQRPGVRRPRVQQRQRPADQGITQSSQPAGVVVRELIHVHANDFDEHQFRKSVENTLAAGPFIAGLGGS